MTKKIAVLVTDMFEDIEYTEPAKAFIDAGHDLIHVGITKNSVVKGKTQATKIKIDVPVKEAEVDDYDALLIPGGYSPDKLRIDPEAVQFVKNCVEDGLLIFSICHGPQLLISADVLVGRQITGYQSLIQDIKNAGAEFVDEEVVVDENIISSRNPDDLPAFIEACLEALEA